MTTATESKEQHLRKLVGKYAMRAGEEFKRGLPSIIREAHESECWREGRKPDGSAFKSLADWLTTAPPPGCGLGCTADAFTYDEVMTICEKVAPDVAKIMAGGRPRQKVGRPAKAKDKNNSSAQMNLSRSPTSAAVLSARLQQEFPDFYQAYLDGEYGSITSAAEAAGLVPHGHDPLKRLRQYWKKASKSQRKEFLKWIEDGVP